MPIRVSIVGVSGFSGLELAKLVAAHPELSLASVHAERAAGRRLGELSALLPPPLSELPILPVADAASAAIDAALLATPAEASAELAPALVARGARVVDLSGAFRLQDLEVFRAAYRFAHPAPALVREARYGLPELPAAAGDAPAYADARLVANPGCYATSAIASLAPLFAAGLVEGDGAWVVGMSGVTGAGKKVEERLLFTEVDENVSPYRVADHQHVPEIEQALSRVASRPVAVRFVPHLLPVKRGLATTGFARLRDGVRAADALRAVEAFYGPGLVRAVPAERVTLAAVQGTPLALVGWSFDEERRTATALGALDNLLKGAASQALQNLCRMVGLPSRLPGDG